jgi:hypothetical protein
MAIPRENPFPGKPGGLTNIISALFSIKLLLTYKPSFFPNTTLGIVVQL